MRYAILWGLLVLAWPGAGQDSFAQEAFINDPIQGEGESSVSDEERAAALQVTDAAQARREADWALSQSNWMASTISEMQTREAALEQTVQYLTAQVVAQQGELERQTEAANQAIAAAQRADATAAAVRQELAALKAAPATGAPLESH